MGIKNVIARIVKYFMKSNEAYIVLNGLIRTAPCSYECYCYYSEEVKRNYANHVITKVQYKELSNLVEDKLNDPYEWDMHDNMIDDMMADDYKHYE